MPFVCRDCIIDRVCYLVSDMENIEPKKCPWGGEEVKWEKRSVREKLIEPENLEVSGDFHEVMKEVRAKLLYGKEDILLGLNKPTMKDIILAWNAIKEEFGCKPEETEVIFHDGHICLRAKYGKRKDVKREEQQVEIKELTEPVKQKDEQKSGEIQEIAEEQEGIKLTDKVSYTIDNGDVVLKYEHNGKVQNMMRLDMEKIYALYEELPEKACKDEVYEVAKKLNIKIARSNVVYLMHFIRAYPVFSADMVMEGGKWYLVKKDVEYSEMKSKLEIEREVIGNPWEAR